MLRKLLDMQHYEDREKVVRNWDQSMMNNMVAYIETHSMFNAFVTKTLEEVGGLAVGWKFADDEGDSEEARTRLRLHASVTVLPVLK